RRDTRISNLSWKSSRTPVSLLWLHRSMMEAFVRPQNRRRVLEKRFDYLALVPAAAAICYPFLLNAFHAIVGTQDVSPLWLAIATWSQSARDPVVAAVPAVGGWRVVHGVTAAVLSLYVVFHLTNHLFGLIGPDAHAAVMKIGRVVYRSAVGEPLLVAAMLF